MKHHLENLGVDQVSINVPKIWELLQNSRRQKGAVKEIPY